MDKENNTYSDFNGLVIFFLNGEITDKQIELLKRWINKSEENKKHFLEMKAAWSLTAQSQKADQKEVDHALNELNKKILLRQKNNSFNGKYTIGRIIKIAAVFVLTVSLSSLITYFVTNNRTSRFNLGKDNLVYVYAPLGSKAMTLLPDGTQVWLNAGSKISYAMDYNLKTRIVKLEGEGFFDVKTNPKKPFVVKAKGLDIKAYGTVFNVKAYLEEKEVVTTLVRGKVYIEGKDKQNKSFVIQMKPKQRVTYLAEIQNDHLQQPDKLKDDNLPATQTAANKISEDKTALIVTEDAVVTEVSTSWKENRWVIKGEEIGKLATSLERRFNIRIVFNSEELKNYRFTGIFQNETVEQVFQVLKMTAPLRYEIGQGIVTLSLDDTLKMKYMKYIKAN